MTDEQIKGIARAINPHWWNDDIDLLDFTRAVLARAGQKHPSSGESHEDSLKSRDEALRIADALEATHPAVWPYGKEAAAELRRQHAELDKVKQITLNDTALLRQALHALRLIDDAMPFPVAKQTIAALRERLGVGKVVGKREHITDGSPCWCNPETTYTDPDTGASVIVHKEPQ